MAVNLFDLPGIQRISLYVYSIDKRSQIQVRA